MNKDGMKIPALVLSSNCMLYFSQKTELLFDFCVIANRTIILKGVIGMKKHGVF